MPVMPPSHRPLGRPTRVEANREYDQRRGSARERGYSPAWDKASKGHLRSSPLCRYCEVGAWGEAPRVEAATLVDHLYQHGGDQALFWARQWWVSSCKPCHDGPKQAAERSGRAAVDRLADALGLPRRSG